MKQALIQIITALVWRRMNLTARCLVTLLLVGGSSLFLRGADSVSGSGPEPLRFAFSARMFRDVNENDAKASVKAWALALARERGVRMDTQPLILGSVAWLQEALSKTTIDGAAVTTGEYLSLEPELQGTNLFVSFIGGQYTEEYQLLVRADSGIDGLRRLSGRKISLFDNPRASLAPLWLDLILSKEGLGTATNCFSQVLMAQKLTKVILPVFFRQMDACIVTRRGFETMCELNPQIRSQLRTLVTSPKLVPSLGFIRRGYNSPLRESLLAALRNLEKSAAGAQVLTLFQSDQLHETPVSLLDSARELVEAHRRLGLAATGETNDPTQAPPGLAPRRDL